MAAHDSKRALTTSFEADQEDGRPVPTAAPTLASDGAEDSGSSEAGTWRRTGQVDGASPTHALVIVPVLSNGHTARTPAARLQEAHGLAEAIQLDVVQQEIAKIARPDAGTLFGRGTVQRIADMVEAQGIDLVIVDHPLTPVQQRNLELAASAKVIDRTGLILEIFGERARSHEGQLQVELAALTYQRSRLVRSWTHLERQRGGFGFLGGPGETQIELDRRLIGERITRLKREIADLRRTRALHRSARQRAATPMIALVGYTNAGKSTLFNALSGAQVHAENQLFATLDPTVRQITLPSGRRAALSDTVGFISDLPHGLVAAFRATLEEVQAADIILHVRDVSHPDSEAQREDVERVLGDLDIDASRDPRVIEVLNKTDLLSTTHRAALEMRFANNGSTDHGAAVAVSALAGQGLDDLLRLLDRRLSQGKRLMELDIPASDGRTLAWLYDHGQVLDRRDEEDRVRLRVCLDEADYARFASHLAA
ncbi:GTPase HflX [Azospirillum sp.]|uniref:GTPase HflX n=1 Tax=Azospirillum sp. TaxID=34012 RepID=UPI002D27DFCB|nr:GTPase HflX [Azospirillum sp.]HYF89573.1 GTPase HflX [Azospirillum sp.]